MASLLYACIARPFRIAMLLCESFARHKVRPARGLLRDQGRGTHHAPSIPGCTASGHSERLSPPTGRKELAHAVGRRSSLLPPQYRQSYERVAGKDCSEQEDDPPDVAGRRGISGNGSGWCASGARRLRRRRSGRILVVILSGERSMKDTLKQATFWGPGLVGAAPFSCHLGSPRGSADVVFHGILED
jgi:hypothetical protein